MDRFLKIVYTSMIRVSQTELNIKEHLSTLKPQKKHQQTKSNHKQTNEQTNAQLLVVTT